MKVLVRLTLLVLGWQDDLDDALSRRVERRRGDGRGLSQSTETALLVAGAVLVASIVFIAVRTLVTQKMAQAGVDAGNVQGMG
jgi:hypothetical protein